MMDTINYIVSLTPFGTTVASLRAWTSYVFSCISGECNSLGSDYIDAFASVFASVPNYVGSTIGMIFLRMLDILPYGGKFPAVFHSAFQYFGNTLATIDFIFPVPTLIYCMSFILSIKLVLWGFHVVRVVVYFVRGSSVQNYRF